MLDALKQMLDLTHTENGAATYRSTRSACLDLFAAIGGLRREPDWEIARRFALAYAEDADLAMKTLFFARDVRGGLGERRVFRVILRWLAENEPRSVEKNLPFVAEYGRWDDLLVLLGTSCEPAALACIRGQLTADLRALEAGEDVSLLAKWLPSVNASNEKTVRDGKRIARALHMNDAQYRKTLSALRKRIALTENYLRQRDYTFDYEAQPSGAMLKYRKAFLRNDGARYGVFLAQVSQGEATLHTGALAPYEIIRPALCGSDISEQERAALDATWKAQEDFTNGENALVVVDGSGSMYCGGAPVPAAVALSLGIYFAQQNTGAFRNHFITFSANPQLVELRGRDIWEQVRYCARFNEAANTNLQRVFRLILDAAVKYRIPQKDMPTRLYIISDMEFDVCAEGASVTNFQWARQEFARKGYRLPEVVFWNVASRNRQQPVTRNEQGVALVSGASPRVFNMLKSGKLSPYDFMLEVLGAERYAPIAA